MLKELSIRSYSYQMKKQVYQCFDIVSAKRAATVDRGRLRWLVMRACQNTNADMLSYLFLIDK